MVPEMWRSTDRIFNIIELWTFFALLPPYWPRKSKFWKNENIPWRYHHFTHVPKIIITWCMVPEIWCMTNGQTDRRKKWRIEVGAPPKKCMMFMHVLVEKMLTIKFTLVIIDKILLDMFGWCKTNDYSWPYILLIIFGIIPFAAW